MEITKISKIIVTEETSKKEVMKLLKQAVEERAQITIDWPRKDGDKSC